MRRIFITLIAFAAMAINAMAVSVEDTQHPRLLMQKGEETQVKANINKTAILLSLHNAIIQKANGILKSTPQERKVVGLRMLDCSRDYLKKIFFTSYAYRMTGKTEYAQWAKNAMLKAAAFEDWHPSHFLDVGEMTTGMAIGYDWIYGTLSNKERKTIAQAILTKGLEPSLDASHQSFLKDTINWNQVCNAGMLLGAMAIWETSPKTCEAIYNRSLQSIQLPMNCYEPDGVYGEGVGYWEYGTMFNVVFLAALDDLFGNYQSVNVGDGFLKTGEYYTNMFSPSFNAFRYSDAGTVNCLTPALFWFCSKSGSKTLWNVINRAYKKKGISTLSDDRLAPLAAIWGSKIKDFTITVPQQRLYKAASGNSVASMRTSWTDDNAAYLSVKLGSPSYNHAHMDVGSFVYEWNGIEWACDLGADDYAKLEEQKVSIWDPTQNSGRWGVYRYGNKSHNTLTFDGQNQIVKGSAKLESGIETATQQSVIADLTPVYNGEVSSARRAYTLYNNGTAVIEDLIKSGNKKTSVVWTLITKATVKKENNNTIRLSQNGKTVRLQVSPNISGAKWSIRKATPATSYENQNSGYTELNLSLNINRNSSQRIIVQILPDNNQTSEYGNQL